MALKVVVKRNLIFYMNEMKFNYYKHFNFIFIITKNKNPNYIPMKRERVEPRHAFAI
jgi:hypothetical protein